MSNSVLCVAVGPSTVGAFGWTGLRHDWALLHVHVLRQRANNSTCTLKNLLPVQENKLKKVQEDISEFQTCIFVASFCMKLPGPASSLPGVLTSLFLHIENI
jgi:hypothetical protein